MLIRLGFETAALDAKLLAGLALGKDSLGLALAEQEPVDESAVATLAALMERRIKGESVARIIGEREFYGLAFWLNHATLEPRPDTELLVELAIAALPQSGRLLDLGTGTGCIPISILNQRQDASGVATDIASDALDMARRNAARHGVAARLDFALGDWFDALRSDAHAPLATDAFDLIVSNPPYIVSNVIETLSEEVKGFDPLLALDGGADGIAPYRVIVAEAAQYLRAGGQVMVEIGYDQGASVSSLFEAAGFTNIAIHKDLNGLARVVSAHHIN